jgi:Fe2+ transport system protein B
MNCQECEEKIWIYQELSSSKQKQVDDHRHQCGNCTAVMEEVKQFEKQIAEARTPRLLPQNTAALSHRIVESLSKEKKFSIMTIVEESLSGPWMQYPLRLAALLLIFFFVRETLPTTKQMNFISKSSTVELNTTEFMKRFQQRRTAPITITYYERYQKRKQTNI